jgi:hypothetical protein
MSLTPAAQLDQFLNLILTTWSTHNIPDNVNPIDLHRYASNQKPHQDFLRTIESSFHSQKLTICGNYAEKLPEPYIGYLEGKDVQIHRVLKWLSVRQIPRIILLIPMPGAQHYILKLYEWKWNGKW